MTNLSFPVISDYTGENIEAGLNEMLLAADQAWRKDEILDLASGNASPSVALAQRTMLWRLANVATSGRSVTLPAVARPYLVYLPASASDPVDIKKGTTTISHPVGAMLWYYAGSGANDLIRPAIAGGIINTTQALDFVGCVVGVSATGHTITGLGVQVQSWHRKLVDTHGFHENVTNPSRFTIGAGVDYVNFRVGLSFGSNMFGEKFEISARRNGSTPSETVQTNVTPGGNVFGGTYESGPLACTNGDYFEITLTLDRSGSFIELDEGSYCEMEVLGGSILQGVFSSLPADFKTPYIASTPAINTIVAKRMVTQDLIFPPNFAGSVASVGTNPSGTTTLNVNDNGTTIGTLAFSTSGVPTFATTSGTAKTVPAGHRLELATTGSVNGIAGISATFKGRAT